MQVCTETQNAMKLSTNSHEYMFHQQPKNIIDLEQNEKAEIIWELHNRCTLNRSVDCKYKYYLDTTKCTFMIKDTLWYPNWWSIDTKSVLNSQWWLINEMLENNESFKLALNPNL